MSKSMFERLGKIICPVVSPKMPSRRPAIPTRKRIAIALYKLASCAEYRIVAQFEMPFRMVPSLEPAYRLKISKRPSFPLFAFRT
ncbi:hypothetical protein EOD39_4071 [Acipenser ruthenus]|uniref:Uncharacterized protein n=1 Tax=Acipenser ruthenus TaxID=7906 RepID=A0A444UK01_ACIRT|nr:hypothetical protein EOD39_4071 [Acipenser ruthenus]